MTALEARSEGPPAGESIVRDANPSSSSTCSTLRAHAWRSAKNDRPVMRKTRQPLLVKSSNRLMSLSNWVVFRRCWSPSYSTMTRHSRYTRSPWPMNLPPAVRMAGFSAGSGSPASRIASLSSVSGRDSAPCRMSSATHRPRPVCHDRGNTPRVRGARSWWPRDARPRDRRTSVAAPARRRPRPGRGARAAPRVGRTRMPGRRIGSPCRLIASRERVGNLTTRRSCPAWPAARSSDCDVHGFIACATGSGSGHRRPAVM